MKLSWEAKDTEAGSLLGTRNLEGENAMRTKHELIVLGFLLPEHFTQGLGAEAGVAQLGFDLWDPPI